MSISSPALLTTPDSTAELDRLGDEIAELSAHLDAATARLLDLMPLAAKLPSQRLPRLEASG